MPIKVTPPDTLHLVRLAKATPNAPVALPGTDGRMTSVHLATRLPDAPLDRWYVCLAGEVLVDLPYGAFVHLRAGETARVTAGTARTLTPVREATVLVVDHTGP
ncbi:hypothetical protein [Deinococcus pimensis]|uniref:hypothetical protein n=1 Tax=Deinococcus pimensis TaxID=309888 RepID=UPI000488407B|nr:hypothetical protein [Deinococcus pimensis]